MKIIYYFVSVLVLISTLVSCTATKSKSSNGNAYCYQSLRIVKNSVTEIYFINLSINF